MKRTIFILFALVTVLSAIAQTVEGSWTGKLDVMGTQLNLVFNITKGDGGALACTMDSPDQSVKGIPAEVTATDGTKVKITVQAINAAYEGELKDGLLKGSFSQNGMSFPLTLKPEKFMERTQLIGMGLLILLMLWAISNDVRNFLL